MTKIKKKPDTKELDNIVAMDYDKVLDIVRTNPLQFNPERVGDINGLMFVVTTDDSGEREPFVKACLEMEPAILNELYDMVHKRVPEYTALQKKHQSEIRQLKDKLACLWSSGYCEVRPGGIHVVSENPTMFRMTVFDGNETTSFTRAGTADTIVNSIRTDEFVTDDEYDDSYTELVDNESNPTCPVCGSPWQLVNTLPLIHCCRCDANWTHFGRKVFSTVDCVNPADMSVGTMEHEVEAYLASEYVPSNPKYVEDILRMVKAVPGKKVVEISWSADQKEITEEVAFQAYDGEPSEMRHFIECIDVALYKCGIRRDCYVSSKRCNYTDVVITLYVPDYEDTDLDEFDELLHTDDQPAATMYSFMVMRGIFGAVPEELAKEFFENGPFVNTKVGDISKHVPELSSTEPYLPKYATIDEFQINDCTKQPIN